MRRRHLVYFVALAERLSERIRLPEAERVLARLDAEHDDVRAALAMGGGERGGGAGAAAGAGDGSPTGSSAATCARASGWLERALGWGETPPSVEGAGGSQPVGGAGAGPGRARLAGPLPGRLRPRGGGVRRGTAHRGRGGGAADGGECAVRAGPGGPGPGPLRGGGGAAGRGAGAAIRSWSRRWSPGPCTSVGSYARGAGSPSPPATWRARPAIWRRRSGGSGRWASPGG